MSRATAFGAAPGGAPTATVSTSRPPTPDPLDALRTRQTHRLLLMRGLTIDEAANLTAFMCGIPIADAHWSLRQVNQLLFLRELARSGRFGPADGGPPGPH